MKTQPISPTVSFGIYLRTRKTSYGQCDYGVFKNHNFEFYTAKENGKLVHKLAYVSDFFRNFVKSKLTYFENGIKKIVRSEGRK